MLVLPPPGRATRLVLIRHANAGADGRICGSTDVPLIRAGRRQAELLADELSSHPLAAVYSSPLRRALETAAPLAAAHGLEPEVDTRLREIDFGDLEGRAYADVQAAQPALLEAWYERPSTVSFPRGESFAAFRARVLAAADELRRRNAERSLALVTHAGITRVILGTALQMPPDTIFRLDQPYGAVSVIDWLDGVPFVRAINSTA